MTEKNALIIRHILYKHHHYKINAPPIHTAVFGDGGEIAVCIRYLTRSHVENMWEGFRY